MRNAKDDKPKRGHGPLVTDDPSPGGKPDAAEEEGHHARDEEGQEQTIPTPTPPEVKEEAR